MKFLLGAVFGLFVICGALFLANEMGLDLEPKTALNVHNPAESQNAALDENVPEPEVQNEDTRVVEDVTIENIVAEEDIDISESSNEPVIRQGTEMTVEERDGDQGHFISTTTGEIVTDAEASAHILPENIHLFLAETSQFRLESKDLDGLPKTVKLVVWPNSDLTTQGRPFYLLTPPLNVMDKYALQDIVNDQDGFYQKAFPSSNGVFVRDLAILAEASNFTKAVYAQMAESNKSLIIFSGYVDPNLNRVIDETQVDFQRIDFVIDQHHERVSVKAQWDAIVEKARHGEELNILLEADEFGLADLKAAIGG